MSVPIEKTQQQILKHHGGNASEARQAISSSYERRHDADFWQFWQKTVGANHQSGDGIVDMGAGIGQFVRDCGLRYPDSSVIGLEAAPYMLEHTVELPKNARIVQDDLNFPKAEIAANSVSMVMANMVVHELTQPIKMFKAAYNWLKPGGRLCVVDVVRQPLKDYLEHRYTDTQAWGDDTTVADLEDAFEHFLEHNRYHPEDIIFMLELGGFKLVDRLSYRNDRFVRLVVEK